MERRRLIIISLATGIVVGLLILVIGFVLLLRGRATETENIGTPTETPNELTVASDQPLQALPSSSEPPSINPSSVPGLGPDRKPQASLAVKIHYARAATFDLSFSSIARTWEIPTVQWQVPAPGQPYSVLEIYDAADNKIGEHKFSMPTEVALEGDAGNVAYALPESTLDIVAPVPPGAIPTRLKIVTDTGQTLDERSFVYRELPEDVPQASPVSSLWRRLLGNTAAAATEKISLVVINQPGAQSAVGTLVRATKAMVKTIVPWKMFADVTSVVGISNNRDLSCIVITGPNGSTYPACPNSGEVIRVVQEKEPGWSGIVVPLNVSCNCGVSFLGSHIIAVGTRTTPGVVAHEFGHAIGELADEYYYQFNGNGPAGPNCFDSEASCREAITPFLDNPDAKCSFGCNNTTSWRPSNRIMHNEYQKLVYGPLEECFMGHSVADLIGRTYTCSAKTSPTPSPTITPTPSSPTPSSRNGNFYGGGR